MAKSTNMSKSIKGSLDDRKMKAIRLLIENNLTKSDIAKQCDRSREWLYRSVLDDEECKKEMQRQLHEIRVHGEIKIKSQLNVVIDNIVHLAIHATSESVKLQANEILLERILGKVSSNLNINVENKEEKISLDDIDMLRLEENNPINIEYKIVEDEE